MPDEQTDIVVTHELFEQLKEGLGRFSSLLNVLLAVVGFYYTILNFTTEKILNNGNSTTLIAVVKDLNIILCFVFLLTAFGTIITNMFKTVSYNKLVNKGDSIQFREDYNLPQYNVKLFSAIKVQEYSYILASSSIAFSLFSLMNYFLKSEGLLWFIVAIMILSCMAFVALSFFSKRLFKTKWFCKVSED